MDSIKKAKNGSKSKRKVARTTIEVKKEIVSKFESGIRLSDLAKEYGLCKSTVCSMLKKKEIIKTANVAKGVKSLTKQRTQVIEEMEKLLLIWITEKRLTGDRVTQGMIIGKAKQLHSDLLEKSPGASADTTTEVFKASTGWLDRFKKRCGIYAGSRNDEDAESNREAAEKFGKEFTEYVKTEGFLPQQVFNCDETGLFWKKMPKKTYLALEERALPGHKPMKDRLTLLLCGNASGDFKVKPLLVYHSENPRAFKKNKVIKSKLAVMWRANSRAWVTRQFFIEWIHEVFGPSVKTYLQNKNLPLKCLLVMDSAPAHPRSLEDELVEEFGFITVKFLPPYITPLVQPMDQQVILNFKKLYTKALFQKCFDATSDSQITLRDFWRNHFNILQCITLIDKAWRQITCGTVNAAWTKLWPDCLEERDFEEQEDEYATVVEEIVSLGQSMGLEVDKADVEELVKEHRNELTTDELGLLQMEQQKIVAEEMASEIEERMDKIPSGLIGEMCAKWNELQNFVEKHHPDKAVANRAINLFNDNAMSHFRNILQRRMKQVPVEGYATKQMSNEAVSVVQQVAISDICTEWNFLFRQ